MLLVLVPAPVVASTHIISLSQPSTSGLDEVSGDVVGSIAPIGRMSQIDHQEFTLG